ncbi:hypothetical protein I5535_00285 [Rhodobacteraceae bacterium F11138]|nr:hypothetical protein [Rhodobacteraceae bacterium F11138]
MSNLTLTAIHLRNGIWLARISGPATETPQIEVRHQDQTVPGITLTPAGTKGQWDLSVPIPAHALTDGVQVFAVFDRADQTSLGAFTLTAGETDTADLRNEVELLRAELDMLKRAFRRHCRETGTS